ncbi:Abhydrolase domain-containing protein [Smittium mucronatum]|uniref:Abhydrolase domain-containing protein n=1 Tax=Smittium mucronatum TaxID=133383 RepID=A0A1R0H7I8_9FUNG|nr:Abhydrolase domain-containing protein [Smittium mucronatum]
MNRQFNLFTLFSRGYSSNSHAVPPRYLKIDPTSEGANSSPLVLLHGLLGSKKNWTSLSKRFSKDLKRTVYALDLRNHGESEHVRPHDYQSMSEDVLEFIKKNDIVNPIVLGHSMGGKVAMVASLTEPDIFSSLIVEDMSPVYSDVGAENMRYVIGLKEIVEAKVKSLKQADEILKKYDSDLTASKVYVSRIPLDIIGPSLDNLSEWDMDISKRFNKPSLLIGGTKSSRVTPEGIKIFRTYFPDSDVSFIDSGHWVHSEKPEEFVQIVESFINKNKL